MENNDTKKDEANPLQKVDRFYAELVAHYGDAEDREIRAAAKLLLVALESFRRHGGAGWRRLVDEYLVLLDQDPDKFDRIIKCQRYPGRPQRSIY